MNKNSICPYLGKKDDPYTPILYASMSNRCHRGQDAVRPALPHQGDICLCEDYLKCPIFKNGIHEADEVDLDPDEVHQPSPPSRRKIYLGTGILLTVVILFGTQLILTKYSAPLPQEKTTAIVTEGFRPIEVDSLTQTELALPTEPAQISAPVQTQTQAHEPSITPHTIVINLDQPFGGEIQFVVHQIASGETFELLGKNFNTTFIAMQKVNSSSLDSFQVGSVLVIPLDAANFPTDMPVFTPYQVEADVMLRDLIAQLGGVVNEVTLYNGLNGEDIIAKGSWILLPGKK
jgi:hypothetical protein